MKFTRHPRSTNTETGSVGQSPRIRRISPGLGKISALQECVVVLRGFEPDAGRSRLDPSPAAGVASSLDQIKSDVDSIIGEPALAICEIELPHPLETPVEAKLLQ